MIYDRRFVVTLDIPDPFDFETDRDTNALLLLKDGYCRRCRNGTYIVEIIRILQISSCRINNGGDNPSWGTVEVEFLARCSQIVSGGCIAGMKIVSRDIVLSGVAVGPQAELKPIVLTMIDPNATIRQGQTIPVRVQMVEYPPMQREPSATATLLTCRKQETVWVVAPEARQLFEAGILRQVAQTIENAIKVREKMMSSEVGNKSRKLFENLLWSYRRDVLPPLPPGLEPTPLENYSQIQKWVSVLGEKGGRWVRPHEKSFDWAGVCSVAEGAELPADRYHETHIDAAAAVSSVLGDILASLEILNELPKVYASDGTEMIQAHMHIWKLMRLAQYE